MAYIRVASMTEATPFNIDHVSPYIARSQTCTLGGRVGQVQGLQEGSFQLHCYRPLLVIKLHPEVLITALFGEMIGRVDVHTNDETAATTGLLCGGTLDQH